MTPLYGHSETVAAFVAGLLPDFPRGFGPCSAIGVLDGDRLVAGLVYHNWQPEYGIMEMSCAAITRRWLTRPILRAIYEYPFDQVGCQMVAARVSEDATHLRRMWKALGANEYIIPRLRGRAASEAILTLTDDAWRASKFMRGPNGKAESTVAA